MSRLLIVSNRLPITVEIKADDITFAQASGGLATGVRRCHERWGGLWIGWPGVTKQLTPRQRTTLAGQLHDRGIVPLYLSRREVTEYYEEFSNGVLWPLFHYLLDRIPLGPTAWPAYRAVNERFAEAVAAQYQPGDLIWVHDYQLLLVPGLLRQRLPHARIGFFLHIPFPADEVFRILPWRREILAGLLGADLVGFHTYAYVQHFAAALACLSGVDPEEDRVWLDDREVRFGVFPMGIDADAFRQLAESPAVEDELVAIRREAAGRTLLLGVDRLDYTKGIPGRLLAVERLLADDPSFRERVRLIQVAVPSRDDVASYRMFRWEIDEIVGRINGTHGTVASVPIHYLHQAITPERLVALYRAADVMLVTPLRDGMNLVAKEYVASRIDEDGVLVISEFAGAAEELPEAISVNAYDVDDLTRGIREAIGLPASERQSRMRAMRSRVIAYDVHHWANDFVRALEAESESGPRVTPEATLTEALGRLRTATSLAILLDYDGTLVPIVNTPEQAAPDADLLDLIAALARRPRTVVQMVSGRSRETLETWFGELSIGLWAEHGIWFRAAAGSTWESAVDVSCAWMPDVRATMERFTLATPGSRIEEKTSSIAWHYRQVGREFGRLQARELRIALSRELRDVPLDIIEGKRVLEVRPRGASKAAVVQRLLSHETPPSVILALGDDRTDEEMFTGLPPNGISVHVGPAVSLAMHRLRDSAATRAFLSGLLV
ncbi:MAG: bifunctional alpha,alpha-trehalose-phosphate synthase (UDP-forming)/trehalose-phosphatase [Acidobacteria bacterium]|nr:MAG: bifunctional alpha,alpha-trehalose-phosphate synthase (UDP-forming)/trehalose-phosphatase [Acidobacteriota bacterium]